MVVLAPTATEKPSRIAGAAATLSRALNGWMPGREAELAAEVRDLKLLVADLSARVRKLELEQESFKEFELVSSSAAGSTEPVPQAAEVAYPVPTEQEKILIGVGKWIRDRVQGLGRGLSGREKIPQQSRIYLLFKDFDGKVYNPARLFFRWRDLEPLVKRPTGDSRQDFGTSVYIGLPNQADGKLVCRSAGVEWPSAAAQ